MIIDQATVADVRVLPEICLANDSIVRTHCKINSEALAPGQSCRARLPRYQSARTARYQNIDGIALSSALAAAPRPILAADMDCIADAQQIYAVVLPAATTTLSA